VSSAFAVYLELGFRHIADLAGYDHLLFIVALAAGYGFSHWRELLVLVTAFTVGHSITLALATLRVVAMSSVWVEFLIPLTILLTALNTLWEQRTVSADAAATHRPPDSTAGHLRGRRVKYGMALFFGLIHGMGFSNFLRALLGEEEGIAWPLFSFNVGLEIGQLVILAALLLLTWVVVRLLRVRPVTWTRFLSLGAALPALALLASRVPG
jgi:hypothetical protein